MILTFLQITNSHKYYTPPGEKCGLVTRHFFHVGDIITERNIQLVR